MDKRKYRRDIRRHARKLKRYGMPEKARIWLRRIRNW